jgi:cytochrome P450
VICELLGVPSRDRPLLSFWSTALAASLDHLTAPDSDSLDRGDAAAAGLTSYFRDLVARRRVPIAHDLLSGLLAATQHGTRLSEDELLATCVLLFFAGHETTVNLIGNGMLALLRHPGQLQRIREGEIGIEQAVEELLRFDSPVQRSSRVLLDDVEFAHGEVGCAGEYVVLLIGAANRDSAQFAHGEQLDLARSNASRHLSFGAGIHYCVGAPLARLEAQVAITELVGRLPNLRRLDQALRWRPTYGLRGLETLPVTATNVERHIGAHNIVEYIG